MHHASEITNEADLSPAAVNTLRQCGAAIKTILHDDGGSVRRVAVARLMAEFDMDRQPVLNELYRQQGIYLADTGAPFDSGWRPAVQAAFNQRRAELAATA